MAVDVGFVVDNGALKPPPPPPSPCGAAGPPAIPLKNLVCLVLWLQPALEEERFEGRRVLRERERAQKRSISDGALGYLGSLVGEKKVAIEKSSADLLVLFSTSPSSSGYRVRLLPAGPLPLSQKRPRRPKKESTPLRHKT